MNQSILEAVKNLEGNIQKTNVVVPTGQKMNTTTKGTK